MSNDLAALPWGASQFCSVDNYLEAVGVLCAMRAGVALNSVRRPILSAPVTEVVRRQSKARRSRYRGSLPGSQASPNGYTFPDVP
jgi:hypothetical protein